MSIIIKKALAGSLSAALLVSGCSIRPLPGDWKKSETASYELTTEQIVQRIRCEARSAVAKVVEKGIADREDGSFKEGNFNLIASSYDLEKKTFATKGTLNTNEKEVVRILEIFAKTQIGYGFKFDITESNDASDGKINLDIPTGVGSLKLDLGGAYQRKRRNVRQFAFAETIGELAKDHKLQQCNEFETKVKNVKNARKENWHLPLSGHIGLIDSFSTFAYLALGPGFGIDSQETLKKAKVAQDLRDTITFTTTLVGSVNPKLTVEANKLGGKLTAVSANASNSRMAIHELLLIIQPDKGSDQQLCEIFSKIQNERDRQEGLQTVFNSFNTCY